MATTGCRPPGTAQKEAGRTPGTPEDSVRRPFGYAGLLQDQVAKRRISIDLPGGRQRGFRHRHRRRQTRQTEGVRGGSITPVNAFVFE